MSNIQTAPTASTQTFVTALVFNAAVFGIELAIFSILRPRFNAIYQPRTYVPPKSKRIAPMSSALFAWPIAVFNADYHGIIKANGLDAYFFVRFLRMMFKVFLPIWVISWAVLLPVTSVRSRVGQNEGLDLFTYGNVAPNLKERYSAHIVLVWVFTFWICWNIRKEMGHFILTRQKYLMDPEHAKSVQATTLLVTGVPAKYLTIGALEKLFGNLPGGIKNIWINRNLKELPEIYDRRLQALNKLESAETKLLSTAAKAQLKEAKEPGKTAAAHDPEAPGAKVPRPTHKLGFLGLFGEKVDSIDWAQKEIHVTSELLAEGRQKLSLSSDKEAATIDDAYPALNSAFIQFNSQIAAHLGAQALAHHEPYRMSGRHIEVAPEDIIWNNLGLNPYEMKIRTAISWGITAVLIIFWAIPVTFVGIISNIYTVCGFAPWLNWICDIPSPVIGIISGILPPVMLAVLMMLLPIVLRKLAQFEGIPQQTACELSLTHRFFLFHVVHSFLLVSMTSGVLPALEGIADNPTGVPTLLATTLPQASNFFLTYILLQGFSGTAGGFLQLVPLIIYYVKLFLLGSTPRSVWGIKYAKRSPAWGTTWPGVTLIVTIALGYSILSPIVNGLACATFFAFFLLYKYLFLYVFDSSGTPDTGGLFFPRAMQHTFVGLYVQQVCLMALFFLAQDENGNASAIPQGALTAVLIGLTAFFHIVLNNSFDPLIHALPLSLADQMHSSEPITSTNSDSPIDPSSEKSPRAPEPSHVSSAHPDSAHSSRHGLNEKDNEFKILPEDHYGFLHPAASRPQRVVWLPKDRLGIAMEEASSLKDAGIIVSLEGAEMNEKGQVDVTRGPPEVNVMLEEENDL